MAKRIRGLEAEADYTEWAVEYEVNGEAYTYEAKDEAEARAIAGKHGGRVLVRCVFETSWA